MDQKEHHEELIGGAFEQLNEIFENSEQAIYLYLDDVHKVCNKKFASLLGYSSPDEWAMIEDPVNATVASKSQETLVKAYRKAMEKMAGSAVKITWKKKNGGTADTTVIMVPIIYKDHLFALHFVSD
jgi:hypothetical protein